MAPKTATLEATVAQPLTAAVAAVAASAGRVFQHLALLVETVV
jgi:hypothetical protein